MLRLDEVYEAKGNYFEGSVASKIYSRVKMFNIYLSIFIFVYHDVTDAEIAQDDGAELQQILVVLFHQGFVPTSRLLERYELVWAT